MSDIALAYVTCDKYAHVWKEWYEAFEKHWGCDLPCYFCGETIAAPFFEAIPHRAVPVEQWAEKLSAQVEKIPEEYIFVWLDDHIQKFNIDKEFLEIALWIRRFKPDALRIMPRSSVSRYHFAQSLHGRPLHKLWSRSAYRVSFSPNIYQRDFLLDVLKKGGTPWELELYSQVKPEREIYAYHIDGWCENKIISYAKTGK